MAVYQFNQCIILGKSSGCAGEVQIMDVIAHEAERIKLKSIFVLSFFDSVEKHLSTLYARETKLAIIAAGSDVIAKTRLMISWFARHE